MIDDEKLEAARRWADLNIYETFMLDVVASVADVATARKVTISVADLVAEIDRLREEKDGFRRAAAEIIGEDPETWPSHGNAFLAIAASLQVQVLRVDEARAGAARVWEELRHCEAEAAFWEASSTNAWTMAKCMEDERDDLEQALARKEADFAHSRSVYETEAKVWGGRLAESQAECAALRGALEAHEEVSRHRPAIMLGDAITRQHKRIATADKLRTEALSASPSTALDAVREAQETLSIFAAGLANAEVPPDVLTGKEALAALARVFGEPE